MQKPEWEQKLPAGYRMATEADRGTPIGADWNAWFDEWEPIRPNVVGTPLDPWTGNGGSHVPMCIPVAPESKDRKETGYTMSEIHEALISGPREVHTNCRPFGELSHAEFLNWVADRLVHVHHDSEGLDFVRRLRDIASSLPIPPKPFTPNKYTRYIPTLDGRKVPVDVYCVLAAFPTGSSAVDHAVKKLLAPGQRGAKSRIQDLKEARDSLTRAIELEEAVEG